jgi:hypothetical protein
MANKRFGWYLVSILNHLFSRSGLFTGSPAIKPGSVNLGEGTNIIKLIIQRDDGSGSSIYTKHWGISQADLRKSRISSAAENLVQVLRNSSWRLVSARDVHPRSSSHQKIVSLGIAETKVTLALGKANNCRMQIGQ